MLDTSFSTVEKLLAYGVVSQQKTTIRDYTTLVVFQSNGLDDTSFDDKEYPLAPTMSSWTVVPDRRGLLVAGLSRFSPHIAAGRAGSEGCAMPLGESGW
jgi:hypothetical protein